MSRIPENDAIGVTVVLLTCSYRTQEFIRVGYFINNEYSDLELRENAPSPPQFDKVSFNLLQEKNFGVGLCSKRLLKSNYSFYFSLGTLIFFRMAT